jgi:zinc D-Ala-D-Ala carboxypeptidase
VKVAAFTNLKVAKIPKNFGFILPISMGDISEHYSSREFFCSCRRCEGFSRGAPSVKLLAILEGARALYGRPIYITSGYRCPEHNAEVGGVFPSEHTEPDEITNAADIVCLGDGERFELLKILFTLKVLRIGTGWNFIHVGVSPTLPQPCIWLYK